MYSTAPVDWARQWRGAWHSPKFRHHRYLTRLFSVISRTLVGGQFIPSAEMESVYSTAPANWAIHRVNVKTVLFQIIQFSISMQFKCEKKKKQTKNSKVNKARFSSFEPIDRTCQVLPLRARVNLGTMATKGYSTFPQSFSIAGTSPSDCLVSYQGRVFFLGGVLSLCRETVGVFYSPSWLGNPELEPHHIF